MDLEVEATANVDEINVDKKTTATGKINLNVTGGKRDYPLHIVFCIDTSNSMSGGMTVVDSAVSYLTGASGRKKIEVAREGLIKAVERLSANDTFGIVSFSSSYNVELQPTSGSDVNKARSKISSITTSGGTDIESGLRKSRKMLDSMPSEDCVEWIVLISDGRGSTPSDRRLKSNYTDNGITIQSAGIGDGYDRREMLNLSQKTQGELEEIDSAKHLKRFFGQEVKRARQVVARDADLRIKPTDLITINEVYYSLVEQTSVVNPEWRAGDCIVDLGDINRESPPEVVFEMDILASEDDIDLSAELAEAVVSTREERGRDSIEVTVGLPATELGMKKEEGGSEDKEVGTVVEKTDPGFVVKKVSTLSQEGDLDEARRYLEKNKEVLSNEKYREAKEMIDESDVTGLGKL